MRIVIVGAGIAGRSLWRFLELQDKHDVEIFDSKKTTRCGLHPCAWGVNERHFMVAHAHLQLPIKTVYRKFDRLDYDGDMIRCNLCTFDKPRFLDQMCDIANIQYGFDESRIDEYDVVVDATGEKRALMPGIAGDLKIVCRQALYRTDKDDLTIAMFPNDRVPGYAWVFPLNNGFVHIGQGNMMWSRVADEVLPAGTISPEMVKAMQYAGVRSAPPACRCAESKIRLLTPIHCRPLIWKNIVACGESAGAVSPHSGAGIRTSIACAKLLAEHIGDEKYDLVDRMRLYEMAVIKEFSFMNRETDIVRKLMSGRRLNISDLICLYKNDRWFGLYPGPMQIIKALRKMGAKLL